MRRLEIGVFVAACLIPVSTVSAEGRISLSFTQAPLTDVISAFEELTGSRISVTPTPSSGDVVTATMNSVTVPEALTRILSVHAYSWEFRGQSLKSFGFDGDAGLIVRAVEPGTLAARAGLKPGDVITSINGLGVETRRDAVKALNAGVPVTLTIRRGVVNLHMSIEE